MVFFLEFFDSIVMFIAGACVTYIGRNFERLNIGDKMPALQRDRIAKSMRTGGPILMVVAILLAVLRALLSR